MPSAGVGGVAVAALAWLGGINVLLAVFNVIPAAPLDGGRLLRAVVWRITGDRFKAAVWSARSGQVFGWALVVVAAYLVLVRREYNWLWFALLGWFLISAATAEGQQATLQSGLRTIAVREIMTAHPVTVPASATVAWFLDDYLPWHRHSAFPVEADDGQTVGLVTVHRVNQVPAAERGLTPLRDVACPLSDVARATPDEPVADVLPRLNECSENRALVFADGHLAGIVSPADISRAVERLSRGPGARISQERSRWRAFCMALTRRFLAGYASVTGVVQFRRAGAGGHNPHVCLGVVVGRLPPWVASVVLVASLGLIGPVVWSSREAV